MESRARRFNPHAAPDESPLARPSTLNLHGSNNSSKGHHGRTAGGGSSTITWIVRLFAVVLCCGLALQWWVWSASSSWSNGVASSDEQAVQEERIGNGWMNHLRRVDPEESKAGGDDDADATDGKAEPLLPTNPISAEEYQARRKGYDPANHSKDQKKVVDMVKWAWEGYATYAYGHDSLNVRLMEGTGLPSHDMALTLVDSLDTLYLVGMFEEFDKASEWVAKNMEERIFVKGFISFFETTIRLLGGLLSSYNLSGHSHLLELADKLGNALSPAFTRHAHGVPDKDYDVVNKRSREAPSLAEVGSLQLEFKYLARLTGKAKYRNQVEHVMKILQRDVAENYPDGLLPVIIRQGRVADGKVTLGANGDSYYEYLLKQWLLSGKREEKYKKAYITAVNGIMDLLVSKSKPSGLVFIGELVNGKLEPKMDHLVCFVPGMLALGYMHGMPKEHLTLAEQLIETCYQMYAQMEAKLAPEIAYFHVDDGATEDLDIPQRDAFNLLRPETVESLMVLYRATKNEKYRTYGREIMAAFEKQCKLEKGGYTSIGNVATGPVERLYREEMESFFIAETLKYLFLLFSDDSVCPLDEIVFNTEAHPFPIEQPLKEA
ncbi:Mannosyl-oligosaccharide alpha-1,2-mannosidase [Globisporangium polare]